MRYGSFAVAAAMSMALLVTAPRGLLAATGDCGQPGSDGSMASASDALATLKRAVGSTSSCDAKPCVCDVNGDGAVTSSDALRILRVAVGQLVPLVCDCPCGGDPACNDAPQDGDEEFTWREGWIQADAFSLPLLENAFDPDGDALQILSLDGATLTSSTRYGAFSLEADGLAGILVWTTDFDQVFPLQFAVEPSTGSVGFTLDSVLFWYGLRKGEWVELGLDYTVTDGVATDASRFTLRIEGMDSYPFVQDSDYFFTSSQVNDGLAELELAILEQNFYELDFEDRVAFRSIVSVGAREDVAGPALAFEQLDEFNVQILDGIEVVAVLTYEWEVGFTIESKDSDFWSNLRADQSVAIEVGYRVQDTVGLFEEGYVTFWITGVAP